MGWDQTGCCRGAGWQTWGAFHLPRSYVKDISHSLPLSLALSRSRCLYQCIVSCTVVTPSCLRPSFSFICACGCVAMSPSTVCVCGCASLCVCVYRLICAACIEYVCTRCQVFHVFKKETNSNIAKHINKLV